MKLEKKKPFYFRVNTRNQDLKQLAHDRGVSMTSVGKRLGFAREDFLKRLNQKELPEKAKHQIRETIERLAE